MNIGSTLCWETIQGKGAAAYPEGNKRLALLGDALIRSELVQRWFQTEQTTGNSRLEKPLPTRYSCLAWDWLPEAAENPVSRLARNSHLTTIGRSIGLER